MSVTYTEAAVQFPTYNDRSANLSWKSMIEKIRSTKVDAGNLKHELLNWLRSAMAVNVLRMLWAGHGREVSIPGLLQLTGHKLHPPDSRYATHFFTYVLFSRNMGNSVLWLFCFLCKARIGERGVRYVAIGSRPQYIRCDIWECGGFFRHQRLDHNLLDEGSFRY
jgi:hypothetical protein